MLTETTVTGIQLLIHLGLHSKKNAPYSITLDEFAEIIQCSPAYLKKIGRMLVNHHLIHAKRGAKGGVSLTKALHEIHLSSVVEACQGMITGDYCQPVAPGVQVCGFHKAMAEIHQATISILDHWTLDQLARHPHSPKDIPSACRLAGVLKS